MKTLKTLLSGSFIMISFLCVAASLQSFTVRSENGKKPLLIPKAVKSNLVNKQTVADSSEFTVYLDQNLASTDWTVTFSGYDDDHNYITKVFTVNSGSYIMGKLPYGYYDVDVNCDNYNGSTEIDMSAYGYSDNLRHETAYIFYYGAPNKIFHSVDLHSSYGMQIGFSNY